MRHELILGTSEAQDFQLRNNGEPLVGTGLTVAIAFRTAGLTGAQLTAINDVVANWLDQDAGTVRVTGMQSLPLGNYYLRFSLTNGSEIGFAPNEADAVLLRVVKV